MKTLTVAFLWLLAYAAALAQESAKIDPLVAKTNEIISISLQGGYAAIQDYVVQVLPKETPAETSERQRGIEDFAVGLREIERFRSGFPKEDYDLFKFDDVKAGKKEDGNSDCAIFTFRYPLKFWKLGIPTGYTWILHYRKEKSIWKLDRATRRQL